MEENEREKAEAVSDYIEQDALRYDRSFSETGQ